MLRPLALALVVAQPTPFHTVKHPEVDPTPWRDEETLDVLFTADQARMGTRPGDPRWKQEAAATLTVRKTERGFSLTLRRSRWWSGVGQLDCSHESLVHALDQDVTLDQHGYVTKLTLRPPPPEASTLAGCSGREAVATALWNGIATLTGAAKQLVFSHRRTPAPDLGPDGFLDRTVSYQKVACGSRTTFCFMGIVTEHHVAGPGGKGPVDRKIEQRMEIDAEGRFHRYYWWRIEMGQARWGLEVVFRPRAAKAAARARPRPR